MWLYKSLLFKYRNTFHTWKELFVKKKRQTEQLKNPMFDENSCKLCWMIFLESRLEKHDASFLEQQVSEQML